MYAMIYTRPDICYGVGLVSQFHSNPEETYWQAFKKIMKYLKGTKNYKIGFRSRKLDVVRFCNANFVSNLDEKKLTSSHLFLFGRGVVSWSSKKQTFVTTYTMESKFIACSVATMYAI